MRSSHLAQSNHVLSRTAGPLASRTSSAELWVVRLPLRWAATGAATGLAISGAVLLIAPFSSGFVEAGLVLLAAAIAGGLNWLLIGYWARWSLREKFAMSPESALAAIRDNWLTGAAILAGAPIVLRRLTIELNLYPGAPPTTAEDVVQAAIALTVLLLGASVLSVISARGLSRQLRKG